MKNNTKKYTFNDNSKRKRFVLGSFKMFMFASIFVLVMSVSAAVMHYICGPYYEYDRNAVTSLIYLGSGLGLIVFTLLSIISGIIYLFWLYRASCNMHALSPDTKFKFSPVLNVVSYFIPFVGLIWPYQAMKELWQYTKSAQSRLSEKVIATWWITFIFCFVIKRAATQFGAEGFQNLKVFTILMIPVAVFGIISSYQMIRIIKDMGDGVNNVVNTPLKNASKQLRIRPLMLGYTLFFALLSISCVHDDITKQYPLIFTVWDGFCFFIFFSGNLLYSLNRVPAYIKSLWKIVFPILVFHFVLSGIYDFQHDNNINMIEVMITWVIGSLFFLPTFRAHYLIGYRAENSIVH